MSKLILGLIIFGVSALTTSSSYAFTDSSKVNKYRCGVPFTEENGAVIMHPYEDQIIISAPNSETAIGLFQIMRKAVQLNKEASSNTFSQGNIDLDLTTEKVICEKR